MVFFCGGEKRVYDCLYLLYEKSVEYPMSFVEVSQKKRSPKELSNNISDWSEA